MTTLVLLHAFPLSSAMWRAQVHGLREDAHVVVPDFRGFGGAPVPDDAEPSLDRLADDVAAVMDAAGIERAVLGGLSMGGYVTMAFLRRHPQRVLGVVLADTKAGADPEPARANRRRIADTLEAEGTTRVLLEDVYPALVGETTKRSRPAEAAEVRELVEHASPSAAAWAQRAMALRADSLDTLRGVAVPALVIRGTEDVLSSAEDVQAMVAALPHGRLVEVPEAGHLTAMERPDAVTTALRDFLREV